MSRFILSVTLFIFGLVLFLGHIDTESGILSLNSNHKSDTLTSGIIDLDNKTYISGEFTTYFQNLNKMSFPLYIPNEFKRGEIVFRVKKAGQSQWHYEDKFYVELLAKNEKAVFSFPPMGDSGKNNYKFEIEYIGEYASGRIAIRNGDYVYTSSYDFFRDHQITPKLVYAFFIPKLLEVVNIPGIFLYLFFAFLPFIIFSLSIAKKWPGLFSVLTGALIITDLTTVNFDIGIVTISVTLALILLVIDGRLGYEVLGLISLIPLSLLVIFDFFGFTDKIGKAASWTYILLFITSLGYIYSAIVQKPEKVGLVQIPRHLIREIAVVIVLLKKVPPLIYKTAAIVLIIKLLILITSSFNDSVKLYLDYFPKMQLQLFFSKTGWQILVVYLVLVPSYDRFIRNSKHKLLITLTLLSILWWGQRMAIDDTTSFRNQVIILEVKPNNISEPWVDVTIEGRNFNELPFYGGVLVDKQKQRIIKWSDREIIFRTDPSVTKTGRLIVERVDGKASNSINFIYSGNR